MLAQYVRAATQWVPFAARTVFYGAISCLFGPLTRDHGASLWAMRTWCKSSTRALRIEVQAEGLENVPLGSAFVYCSNHQSIVDIIVLGSVLPGDYKWAAKRSMFKTPFLGWHLKLAGHVPVDRASGSRSAAAVIERFVEVLGAGKPLLVFPEGTRTPDGALQPFKNGGFYAALRAGVPIVPVAIEGTFDLMRRGALDTGDVNVRVVRVKVGAPIIAVPEGRESVRVTDLRERARHALGELLTSIGGRVGDASAAREESPSERPLELSAPA